MVLSRPILNIGVAALATVALTQDHAAPNYQYQINYLTNEYNSASVDCAPLFSPLSFREQENRDTAQRLLNDLPASATGNRLLTNLQPQSNSTLCFTDKLAPNGDELPKNGLHLVRNAPFPFLQSNTIALATTQAYEQVILTFSHELAHMDNNRKSVRQQFNLNSDAEKTLFRLSDEAYARSISVRVAFELFEQGQDRVLSCNFRGCTDLENCNDGLVTTYRENREYSDDAALHATMREWLTARNIQIYSGEQAAEVANTYIPSATANSDLTTCSQAVREIAPTHEELPINRRSELARYMRPPERALTSRTNQAEISRADSLVDRILKESTVAKICRPSEEVFVPADPIPC